MFANQTSIGKLTAHCPARTELLRTRLRISHLLQSANFTPSGFPPQAILIVRHIAGRQPTSLASFRLDSKWERDVRENVTRLYRAAVKPVRGVVPVGAQAVLFADVGEWLACVGLAVQSRSVEQAWYLRAALQKEAVSSSLMLAGVWAEKPRFVPAAIAHLAEWGRVAEVLQLFSPGEANGVFAAVADEWGLPKQVTDPLDALRAQLPLAAAQGMKLDPPVPGSRTISDRRTQRAQQKRAAQSQTASAEPHLDGWRPNGPPPPPWTIWLPTLADSCERLPIPTQRLLASAVALFHAPARARSTRFAAEVRQWLLATAKGRESSAAQSITTSITTASSDSRETFPISKVGPNDDRLPVNTRAVSTATDSPAARHSSDRAEAKTRECVSEVAPDPKPKRDEARQDLPSGPIERKAEPWWLNLSGCQTKLGGVLFLVNLLQETKLPECFDEDLRLSEHIGGWGLVTLLAGALLGTQAEDFRDDPLWTILSQLEGRAPGEPLAPSLPEVAAYRMPPEWLKRFVALDEQWVIRGSTDRLELWHHSGAFAVVDCPLNDSSVAEQAQVELERYRAEGVAARLTELRSHDALSGSSFLASLQLTPGWAQLPRSMRRWMRWTFPFLHHVLLRALGEEAGTPDGLARLLLLKTGTLYCTATHIDLVMHINQIAMPVRRAGLDANPGWLRDLRRVVSFHFE
jgi:hypothetical protein